MDMQSEIIQVPASDSKLIRRILIVLAALWLALCLSATSVGIGFLVGRSGIGGSVDSFGPLTQTWDIIHNRFVHQPVDDVKLIQGGINGMMESLGDENSTYMEPETYQSATDYLEGYEGIGAEVDIDGDYLTILATFPGSPAEKAGLKPGDEIVKIDGVDMTGKNNAESRDHLLGPAGTHVVITIRRSGEPDLLEFDIVRAKIEPPVVESRMLDGNIGYVSLGVFSETADPQLEDALNALLEENPGGLILDLRQNLGGLVSSAVDVGSQFLPENTLLFYEKDKAGKESQYFTHGGGLATEIPLVVLVDGYSASASEILAGALQDHRRAQLVGTTTYGKGSVQEWIPLMNNLGAIRITVALWYTPNGRQIDGQGLTPDVEVGLSEAEFQAGEDPQLDRALEILMTQKGA
jgi:carboxyl-terminal processing protease